MLCQSFPCLPSDSPLLLRGLTPAKDIPHALYPLVSVRCNQLGWSSGILVSRKKRKARATPSQPPVITSSTGSKFSFYLMVPPASMSQLLQTGLWRLFSLMGSYLSWFHVSCTLVTSPFSPFPPSVRGFLVASYSPFLSSLCTRVTRSLYYTHYIELFSIDSIFLTWTWLNTVLLVKVVSRNNFHWDLGIRLHTYLN